MSIVRTPSARKRKILGLGSLLAATSIASLLAASPANADVITVSIDTGSSVLSPYPGPYGTVTIDRTSSTTANITFSAVDPYRIGDGGSVDLNVNATSFTFTTPTETTVVEPPPVTTQFTPTYDSKKGNTPGEVGPFGSFNLSLNNSGGFANTANTVSFTLTDTSGTWASASSVVIANLAGADVAAHIFVCGETPCNPADPKGAVVTGYAAGSGGGNIVFLVPEPLSLSLFGAALVSVAALRRRKAKS